MVFLVLSLVVLAITGHSSATWCVCKDGPDTVLQKTLDYACGAGADCNPTHQNGPCFNPNTVRSHCSYAVNSYFQKKGQAQGSCDFSGTASLSTSDPSYSGCPYPASASAGGTTMTPGTTNPKTNAPINTLPTTGGNSPYGGTPSTGVLGGVGNGTDATGTGINPDYTDSGFRLNDSNLFCVFTIGVLFSVLML